MVFGIVEMVFFGNFLEILDGILDLLSFNLNIVDWEVLFIRIEESSLLGRKGGSYYWVTKKGMFFFVFVVFWFFLLKFCCYLGCFSERCLFTLYMFL